MPNNPLISLHTLDKSAVSGTPERYTTMGLLTMPSPIRRADSSRYQYRAKVPADIREKAKGRTISIDFPEHASDPPVLVFARLGEHAKLSLRTQNAATAKARTGLVQAHLARVFDSIRQGERPLDLKTTVALSGEVYRLIVEANENEPGLPTDWAAIKAISRAIREGRIIVAPALRPTPTFAREAELARDLFGTNLSAGVEARPSSDATDGALESRYGLLVNMTLMRHGLQIDQPSRRRLLEHVGRAAHDAAWAMKRAAQGDYTPDPAAARFPAMPSVQPQARVTVAALFERWRIETKPAPSTMVNRRSHLRSFVDFIGHEDVSRISERDVIGWKDSLIAKGVQGQSINQTHLTTVRALLSFAARNRLIASNVAKDVKAVAKRKPGTGRLPYTDEEISRLISLARAEKHPYRRWLPLLAVATGARSNELTQLQSDSIFERDGHFVMHITAAVDGGSVKNAGSDRLIPLHPKLIEEGFITFAATKSGPLFYGTRKRRSASEAGEGYHRSKSVGQRLARWIRENGFQDPRKDPMHAVRHWWKTAALRAGVPDSVADAIQGHSARSEADGYRHISIAMMAEAIRSMPIPGYQDREASLRELTDSQQTVCSVIDQQSMKTEENTSPFGFSGLRR